MKQLIFFLLLVNTSLLCQIPEDFQFIDHDWVTTEVMDMLVLDKEILYSSSRGIHKASYDYQLERKEPYFFGQSKLIVNSDSSHSLYQWDIRGEDFGLPGFVFLNVNDDSEEYRYIDTHIPKLVNITPDSVGGWWCLTGDPDFFSENIYHIDSSGLITSNFDDPGLYNDGIYTNAIGDIYIYSSLLFADNILSQLQDTELIPIELSMANCIKDICLWKRNNLVLTGNEVLLTNPTFDTLLHTWLLPEPKDSFKEVQINQDSTLYMINVSENNYQVQKISKSSELLFSFSDDLNQDESLTGIKVLSDTSHVIYGQKMGELSNNLFFRSKSTTKSTEYPTTDIDITNSTLRKDSSSTANIFIGTLELTIVNNGSQPIYKATAYSNSYIPYNSNFDPGSPNISHIPIENFDSQEEQKLSETIKAFVSSDLDDFGMEIPGANYKFNVSTDRYRKTDFLLSLAENNFSSQPSIYPNPTQNFVYLPTGISELLIYNSISELVLHDSQLSDKSRIDISDLQSGLYYFVILDSAGKMQVDMVVKE